MELHEGSSLGRTMMRLMAHDWPGNVRELRNVVERADILFAGAVIGAGEVEALLGLKAGQGVPCIAPAASPQQDAPPMAEPIDLKDLIERVEQERIQSALEAAQGVISEAARLLTLKRTTLIEKMRKYGVGTQAA